MWDQCFVMRMSVCVRACVRRANAARAETELEATSSSSSRRTAQTTPVGHGRVVVVTSPI